MIGQTISHFRIIDKLGEGGMGAVYLAEDTELDRKVALKWLLREAGKTDMERLERFLLKNGPKIPRTTVRYAIERFPKSQRKRLLEATKAKSKKG